MVRQGDDESRDDFAARVLATKKVLDKARIVVRECRPFAQRNHGTAMGFSLTELDEALQQLDNPQPAPERRRLGFLRGERPSERAMRETADDRARLRNG